MSQVSNERVLRVSDGTGTEYYVTDPDMPKVLERLPEINNEMAVLLSLLTAASFVKKFQGISEYSLSGVRCITLSTGHMKILYLWSDGGADYFTVVSPINLAEKDKIYEFSSNIETVLRQCTNNNFNSSLAIYEAGEVDNI